MVLPPLGELEGCYVLIYLFLCSTVLKALKDTLECILDFRVESPKIITIVAIISNAAAKSHIG